MVHRRFSGRFGTGWQFGRGGLFGRAGGLEETFLLEAELDEGYESSQSPCPFGTTKNVPLREASPHSASSSHPSLRSNSAHHSSPQRHPRQSPVLHFPLVTPASRGSAPQTVTVLPYRLRFVFPGHGSDFVRRPQTTRGLTNGVKGLRVVSAGVV